MGWNIGVLETPRWDSGVLTTLCTTSPGSGGLGALGLGELSQVTDLMILMDYPPYTV